MAQQTQREENLYSTEHGTLTEKTTPETEHKHGHMDINDQKRTFEGFIKFWIYLSGAVIAILIFLAIFAA
jgi:hypothetical protein